MGVIDLVAAKYRYAKHRSCTFPEIDEGGVLDLHEARHPVLIELFDRKAHEAKADSAVREVVPIDIRLGDDFDVLIVTGPNTGGKTVAIKTVGLLALMTQCGIPIPVGEGSRMPVFRQIHIDIGDEQSLQQSLSTFSSHLSTQLDIMQHSGPRTLVLIDELGAGTDPDEGAAIGQSIVSELLTLGAQAIVTTHLSALKAIAFTTPRVDNAAVEFDPVSLRPTFHVKMGEPGNSNALIIAKRLGMPARLVKLAKGYLADRTHALNKAIAGTLRSRREAEEARKEARTAALQSKLQRDQYQKDRAELEQSQRAYADWTQWVNDLRPGDGVQLKTLKRSAKVVRMELHRQKALVSTGAIDIEVALSDIAPPSTDAE
jgi:DNA mismatch repair protein MutS2